MPASGVVNSRTFTPTEACDVIVTATFSGQRTTGGDWGSGAYYRMFCTQNSVTTNGQQLPMSTTRVPYTARARFSVVAGLAVEAGLFGGVSGASAVNFYNIEVIVELIKR